MPPKKRAINDSAGLIVSVIAWADSTPVASSTTVPSMAASAKFTRFEATAKTTAANVPSAITGAKARFILVFPDRRILTHYRVSKRLVDDWPLLLARETA